MTVGVQEHGQAKHAQQIALMQMTDHRDKSVTHRAELVAIHVVDHARIVEHQCLGTDEGRHSVVIQRQMVRRIKVTTVHQFAESVDESGQHVVASLVGQVTQAPQSG